MKPNRVLYAAIVPLVFFLPYSLARVGGYWSTSGKFDGQGAPIVATGRDTAEIKGWMTFGDIAKGYNVSLEEIAKAFDLPLDQVTPDKALNKLETDWFSVTKLRQWLDARKAGAP